MSEEKQKELSAKEKLFASRVIASADVLSQKMCDLLNDHNKNHMMNDVIAIMAIGDLLVSIGEAEAEAITALYAKLDAYHSLFISSELKPSDYNGKGH